MWLLAPCSSRGTQALWESGMREVTVSPCQPRPSGTALVTITNTWPPWFCRWGDSGIQLGDRADLPGCRRGAGRGSAGH